MSVLRISLLGLVGIVGSASLCLADVATVNKYLDQAKELVDKGSQFYEDAGGKLDLAEASLDDVPAGEKAALEAKIKQLRDGMKQSANAEQKAIVDRKAKGLLESLEGVIGNIAAWGSKAADFNELMDDPKTVEAIGADGVAAYKKQFSTFQKVHAGKATKENLTNASEQVAGLEKAWASTKAEIAADKDLSPQDRANKADISRDLEQLERFFKDLPADNAEAKALRDRVTKVANESAAAVGDSAVAGQLDRVNEFLTDNKDEFAGVDAETNGATWADYKASKPGAGQYGAPKTQEFLRRTVYFLNELKQRDDYTAVKDNPKLKAAVGELESKVAAAQQKLTTFANKMLDEMAAEKVNKDNIGEAVVFRGNLGQLSDVGEANFKALNAKVEANLKAYQDASDKSTADIEAYYATMTEQATKAWPDMLAKFATEEGFDPNNAAAFKGKLIKLETDNLMGWRFSPNDFPFATTISGVPVAGRYDPVVKAAIAEIEPKIGHTLGDHDSDGKWTIVARVEGTSGQLLQKIQHEGDVTVDGTKVGTVSGSETKPIQAPIITIVAAHCGPLAVAAGQGAVKPDGSVSVVTPGNNSTAAGSAVAVAGVNRGSSIGSRLFGIVTGLFGLTLGAACLMKANFAPLATNANAVQLQQRVGDTNMMFLGLAGVAWGLLGLLMGLIALFGAFVAGVITLLMSAAMIVAGFTVSSGAFEERQLVKPDLAAKLKSFAVPAGLACAALSLLGLVRSVIP